MQTFTLNLILVTLVIGLSLYIVLPKVIQRYKTEKKQRETQEKIRFTKEVRKAVNIYLEQLKK